MKGKILLLLLVVIALAGLVLQRGPLTRYLKMERM